MELTEAQQKAAPRGHGGLGVLTVGVPRIHTDFIPGHELCRLHRSVVERGSWKDWEAREEGVVPFGTLPRSLTSEVVETLETLVLE